MCKAIKLALVFALISHVESEGQYYYLSGQRETLTIDSSKILTKFKTEIRPQDYDSILRSFEGVAGLIISAYTIDDFQVCSLITSNKYAELFHCLDTSASVSLVAPYYLIDDSLPLVIGETICCKFKETTSNHTIDSIIDVNALENADSVQYSDNYYFLKVTEASPGNALEVANSITESNFAIYAVPNLRPPVEQLSYRVYDYFVPEQWQIREVIGRWDTATAWDITLGDSNTIVAVLDDGFGWHYEIPDSERLQGYDFGEQIADDDPTPWPETAHGNACAGIIAANHTTDSLQSGQIRSGIVSLAPDTKLLPVKIFYLGLFGPTLQDTHRLREAFIYACTTGAAVLSCSWYLAPKYDPALMLDGMLYCIQFGRNGKGSIIVSASGNGGTNRIYYPAASWMSLAVGAIDSNDVLWGYSSHGDSLDVVAPSSDTGWNAEGVYSLDQVGAL